MTFILLCYATSTGHDSHKIEFTAHGRAVEIVMHSTRESNMVAGRRRPSREPRMGRLLRPRSAPSLGIKPLILTTRLSSDQDP